MLEWSSFVWNKKHIWIILKICEYKDFCSIVIPSEDTTMLEFNQYQKSIKATFIIYADCEYLIEKFDGCKNNLESTSTAKVGEHSLSVFSMYTISLFKSI